MGLTFVHLVKHGVEDKQGLDGQRSNGICLHRVERAVEAGEVVKGRWGGDAVEVVGRCAGPDERSVVNSKRFQSSDSMLS